MPTSLAAAPATRPVEVEVETGAEGDGQLNAQRDAPVGGQAVLEGVMMRGVAHWAVAVRKPTPEQLQEDERPVEEAAEGEIEVSTFPSPPRCNAIARCVCRSCAGWWRWGSRWRSGSARSGSPPTRSCRPRSRSGAGRGRGWSDAEDEQAQGQEISGGVWAGTIVVALVFAIGLFFVIPVALTSLIKGQLNSSVLFWVVEGIVRTAIFLGYMLLLSRLRDLRRVFEYHGAEHKTISCFEAGLPLTPANAKRFSRLHPRCGTSFLLVVMIVAIFVFAPIGLPAWYWLVATRILGVPVIAGISFELIKFAGRNRRRRWVQVVMWPGLKLQLLTTREPDLDQLAVAIAALEAVLALETPGDLSAADLMGVEVVA